MMGQMTGHRERPVGVCSRQQDDGQSACYIHRRATPCDQSLARRLNKCLDSASFHYTLLEYVLSFCLCMAIINVCFIKKYV